MNTLSITLRYRPVRIGWCIDAGDLEGFRRAVRQSYTMWGGRYNPIIPVNDPQLAEALTSLYRIDLLEDVSKTEATRTFIEAQKHLPNPLHHPLFYPSGAAGQKAPAIVDIRHPIQKLYEEFYKNNQKPEPGVDVYQWEETDPLADAMLCTYGAFPSQQDVGTDYLALIGTALFGQTKIIQNGQDLPFLHPGRDTIATLNRAKLEWDYVVRHGRTVPGFYVGHVDDLADLIAFWNLKAAAVPLVFYDPRYAARLAPIKNQFAADIRAAPARDSDVPRLALWHREERPLVDTATFGESLIISTVSKTLYNGHNLRAPIVLFGKHSALASVGKGFNGRSQISFALNDKPFFQETPNNQHYVLSVDPGIGLFGDERATLFTPFLPALNEFYGRNIFYQWDATRAEPETVGCVRSVRTDDVTMHALDTISLVAAVFKTVGIKAEPSAAGLLCTTLIQQMGGLKGCRVFKIDGVRRLIEDHNPDQSFSRSDAMQMILGQGPTRPLREYNTLYIEQRPQGVDLTNDAVLGYLLDRGVFRAGLKYLCPSCQLEFWRSLDDAETRLECEYCGNIFNSSRQLRDKGWAFRRSGLFGRNDHQDGAIPVTLALQQLMQMHSLSEHVYTTAMKLTPDGANIQACETDFVIVTNASIDGRIQIVIGECKTRKPITADDVAKLKAVADAFPTRDFAVFIVFSRITDFEPDEIALIRTLNEQHRLRAIMLTGRELEPYWPYERTEKEFDINRHAVSFDDMARVTHQVFFENRRKPVATEEAVSAEAVPVEMVGLDEPKQEGAEND